MDPRDFFSGFAAGRVLDVATGKGGMIQHLLNSLTDIQEIVGVDENPQYGKNFPDSSTGIPISFQVMDAARLLFPDRTFDTVSIGNSLHHLKQLPAALGEMLRVLKPGGHLIILEMYSDALTESQLTHVLMHHWWASVDRIHNVPHFETFSRRELVRLIESLGLINLRMLDINDTSYDPHDPENFKQLEATIDQYLIRAAGKPDLVDQGAALRVRLRRTGFHGAPALLAAGKKAG